MKKRVTDLINICSDGLYEREEIVAVSLLSAISGQSIFLYGLPGTAKSLIARRLSHVFRDTTHFEYLMQSFSTPEDVFGPVSIQELKKDNYVRKTDGYLPTADFAFLDEIWKSSPAILNTLLTIINERIYRNNGKDEKVPLKALIAASNETPPANQGLEALYDRFIMRIGVDPMQERENFEKLLDGGAVSTEIKVPDGLQFSHAEWEQFPDEIYKVTISKEVFAIINSIRVSIDEFNKDNPEIAVYVSDRRWQKIAFILKASAFLCDRNEVIPVDTFILRHCLWTLEENREQINEIVIKSVKQFGCVNYDNLNTWVLNHNDIENTVYDTLFYSEDIYDTKEIAGEQYFSVISPEIEKNHSSPDPTKIKIRFYIPVENIGTLKSFEPVDENGDSQSRVECNFNGSESCEVNIQEKLLKSGWDYPIKSASYVKWFDATPIIKVKRGTQKSVCPEVKQSFEDACKSSLIKLDEIINDTISYVDTQRKLNEIPFVPAEKRELLLDAFNAFLNDLENHKLNAEHLLEKVQSHAVSESRNC
ncbi:AAA family ATPase [Methanolobus sp. ZRKC3]|uniref:AAA family ATPase n=1 Tax=Methanolobus sp. ZRKC3 TaxID=3125786 RepID=UPI00324F8DEE